MLGENGIRFFGLDRDRLATIAKRIGPRIEDIIGGDDVPPDLIERFAARAGSSSPTRAARSSPTSTRCWSRTSRASTAAVG